MMKIKSITLKKVHSKFGTEYNWDNDDGITAATFIIIQE